MMKKNGVLTIVLLLSIAINAQEVAMAVSAMSGTTKVEKSTNVNENKNDIKYQFVYFNRNDELAKIDISTLRANYFNKESLAKEHLFEESYTYLEPIGPGSTGMKMIVRKQAIYDAKSKLYRYYKKQVKEGIIDYETAAKAYEHILDVALSVIYQYTVPFEEKLSSIKNEEELAAVFRNVSLIVE